jgi:transcriptional regulator with XRE-family HTH domain
MKGSDWAKWRNRLGYNQQKIMRELNVNSRQTISTWEHAEEVPRLAVLALHALEQYPACQNIIGDRISMSEERKYKHRIGENHSDE